MARKLEILQLKLMLDSPSKEPDFLTLNEHTLSMLPNIPLTLTSDKQMLWQLG